MSMKMIIKSLQSNLSRPILLLLVVIIIDHTAAQPSSQSQDPYGNNVYGNNINPSVGIIIIALVVSLFLLGFFSIYVRHCSGDSSSSNTTAHTLRLSAPNATRGLDASVIESFPTFDYSAVKSLHIGKGALECAVCLNEFEDHETLRLIPKCDHVFHPDCIDAWLVSHTTCPVCRADLTPQPGDPASFHAPVLSPIQDDVAVVDVAMASPPEPELMERPILDRSRTRRTASGRPGWLGILFTRSNSTGHVAVRRWEDMERFTLRLPEEVRSRIISGSLSSRVGPVRVGPGGPGGEGSSCGRRFGSWRSDRAGRSERWGFSLAPPFFTRGPSVRSPKVAAAGGGDSVHDAGAGAAASETNLPPV